MTVRDFFSVRTAIYNIKIKNETKENAKLDLVSAICVVHLPNDHA
jgi:hypothetical protein